jgi:hypothetical protein
MDFFNSLTLDLKLLIVGIAGFALLALFSGNPKAEKRYVLVLAILTAAGVYRFTHLPSDEQREARAGASSMAPVVTPARKQAPLSSTSAR